MHPETLSHTPRTPPPPPASLDEARLFLWKRGRQAKGREEGKSVEEVQGRKKEGGSQVGHLVYGIARSLEELSLHADSLRQPDLSILH